MVYTKAQILRKWQIVPSMALKFHLVSCGIANITDAESNACAYVLSQPICVLKMGNETTLF